MSRLPKVPIKGDQETRRFLELVKQSVEEIDSGRNRAVRINDLRNPAFINDDTAIGGDGTITYGIPPAPNGFTTTGTFRNVILSWEYPEYLGHAFTRIYRNTTNNFETAAVLANTSAKVFADPVQAGVTYYYWVSNVNLNGVEGPLNATAGTSGVAGLIGGVDINDLAISGQKLVDEAITAVKIATSAITTTKIADDAITTPKLVANAITADKIQAGTITGDRLAANTITAATGVIANAAITNAMIANAAVDSAQIATAAIVNAKIADAAISTAKIQNAAITTALINNAAITTAKIADANITAAKIGTAAVERLKIAGNAVTQPINFTASDASITTTASIGYTNVGAGNGDYTLTYIPPTTFTYNYVGDGNGDYIQTVSGGQVVLQTGSITVGDAVGGSLMVVVYATMDASSTTDAGQQMYLLADTGSGYRIVAKQIIGIVTNNGNTYATIPFAVCKTLTGITAVTLRLVAAKYQMPFSGTLNNSSLRNITLSALGAAR